MCGIIDYRIDKISADYMIMPVYYPFVSPAVLCSKNNGKFSSAPEAWGFAIGYHKLNAITQYLQFLFTVKMKF